MTIPREQPLRYADAGVDIDAAETTVARYREIAGRTQRPEVLGGIGSFAGLFRLQGYRDPVLASSTDSVGTKVLVAAAAGRFDTVGQDLVNHCVNDILTTGAEPLFFLDYLATADLPQAQRVEIVAGIGRACEENGVALIGGETADLPDLYRSGDYDIAGFIVGAVERDAVIDGSRIRAGDVLVALPSSGLHTNGYSLVRAAFGLAKGKGAAHDRAVLETAYDELGGTLGDALLAVHRSYLGVLQPLLPRISGWAHITGGGIPGNLPRILPDGLGAFIDGGSWRTPPLFEVIQRQGRVADGEMYRTFNMGVGAILAVAAEDAPGVLAALPEAWALGAVEARGVGAPGVRGLPLA
ncbi:MAG: phosphoribosylformylglycinamidine cyclo-ligase [Dehalococcoidia bacterium]|nr:phosphoribosylformylglycinamidine cyclo-ligase [Dehalococcoidia bacterium]